MNNNITAQITPGRILGGEIRYQDNVKDFGDTNAASFSIGSIFRFV